MAKDYCPKCHTELKEAGPLFTCGNCGIEYHIIESHEADRTNRILIYSTYWVCPKCKRNNNLGTSLEYYRTCRSRSCNYVMPEMDMWLILLQSEDTHLIIDAILDMAKEIDHHQSSNSYDKSLLEPIYIQIYLQLTNLDPEVRKEVIKALLFIGDERAIPMLNSAIEKENDPEVKNELVSTVRTIIGGNKERWTALICGVIGHSWRKRWIHIKYYNHNTCREIEYCRLCHAVKRIVNTRHTGHWILFENQHCKGRKVCLNCGYEYDFGATHKRGNSEIIHEGCQRFYFCSNCGERVSVEGNHNPETIMYNAFSCNGFIRCKDCGLTLEENIPVHKYILDNTENVFSEVDHGEGKIAHYHCERCGESKDEIIELRYGDG